MTYRFNDMSRMIKICSVLSMKIVIRDSKYSNKTLVVIFLSIFANNQTQFFKHGLEHFYNIF